MNNETVTIPMKGITLDNEYSSEVAAGLYGGRVCISLSRNRTEGDAKGEALAATEYPEGTNRVITYFTIGKDSAEALIAVLEAVLCDSPA